DVEGAQALIVPGLIEEAAVTARLEVRQVRRLLAGRADELAGREVVAIVDAGDVDRGENLRGLRVRDVEDADEAGRTGEVLVGQHEQARVRLARVRHRRGGVRSGAATRPRQAGIAVERRDVVVLADHARL